MSEISGKLDSRTSGEAGDQIVAIAQVVNRHVVLDLEKLDLLTSAGMRVIIRGAKLLAENQGELKICNAGDQARELLALSGFDRLLKIYDTRKMRFQLLSLESYSFVDFLDAEK